MTKLKGRVMGARFKTYSGAAKRAQTERFFDRYGEYTFQVEEETDPYKRVNGYSWRIRKTKKQQ